MCCDCKNNGKSSCSCGIVLDFDTIDKLSFPDIQDPMEEYAPNWKPFIETLEEYRKKELDTRDQILLDIINNTLLRRYVL